MLEQWLGREHPAMTIEDYVYWGGIVQGEGLREYIRQLPPAHVRQLRRRSSGCTTTTGPPRAVGRSSTTICRRTPAFYPVRRAMAAGTTWCWRRAATGHRLRHQRARARRSSPTCATASSISAATIRWTSRRESLLPPNTSTPPGELCGEPVDRSQVVAGVRDAHPRRQTVGPQPPVPAAVQGPEVERGRCPRVGVPPETNEPTARSTPARMAALPPTRISASMPMAWSAMNGI